MQWELVGIDNWIECCIVRKTSKGIAWRQTPFFDFVRVPCCQKPHTPAVFACRSCRFAIRAPSNKLSYRSNVMRDCKAYLQDYAKTSKFASLPWSSHSSHLADQEWDSGWRWRFSLSMKGKRVCSINNPYPAALYAEVKRRRGQETASLRGLMWRSLWRAKDYECVSKNYISLAARKVRTRKIWTVALLWSLADVRLS